MLLQTHMFQFTHPGKGATEVDVSELEAVYVSIHAPWEGCDFYLYPFCISELVSIHAPWEGCDVGEGRVLGGEVGVSIHAPWEGCDFYTLAPCDVRY